MTWDATVSTLLMGTERRPGTGEAELLRTATVETTRRRAGMVAAETDFTLQHTAAETAPECSAQAMQLLDLILVDHFGKSGRGPLLAYWLQSCAAAGQIVPARYVPTLLDLGNGSIAIRSPIREVTGRRGRWLAGLTRSWPWLGGTGDEMDAPVDTVVARLRVARDADPARGRNQVVAEAEGLAAAERVLIYEALIAALSNEDEPLLESLLDDRSRKVRRAAADMLSRLPDSAWSARAIARMEPLIERRRRGGRFKVELPEALDDEALRDGIVENPPPSIGRRAWWLRQIVADVPLGWWEKTLDAAPAEIASHAPTAEVRSGWIDAARRQGNTAWAAALFDAGPDIELLEHLDEAAAAQRLAAACRGTKPFTAQVPPKELARMLLRGPQRWPLELSREVVEVIARRGKKKTPGLSDLVGLLDRADPRVADRLEMIAEGLPDNWQKLIRGPISLIRFRSAIDQEFL